MANCPHCSGDHAYEKVPMKKMEKSWYCQMCGQSFEKKNDKWVKTKYS
jgi:transposase-like protein